MLTTKLQQAIVKVYVTFDIPADHIVCDCILASQFADAVNEEVTPDEYYSSTAICRGLLYLRKRGILPRLVWSSSTARGRPGCPPTAGGS
jgi:hypothetical protein